MLRDREKFLSFGDFLMCRPGVGQTVQGPSINLIVVALFANYFIMVLFPFLSLTEDSGLSNYPF